jgi:hypothetical protein
MFFFTDLLINPNCSNKFIAFPFLKFWQKDVFGQSFSQLCGKANTESLIGLYEYVGTKKSIPYVPNYILFGVKNSSAAA